MSKIKRLSVKNFIGIDEKELEAGKVNKFTGPKGAGKTTMIEAIEKAFTNKNRRTEVIKHGTEEATIYVQLDDGLEIERRIREGKADYFKLRKDDEGISSTESYLKKLINGEIFRPLDWVNKSVTEQTKSILNMLEINWSNEDIEKWFGEIPSGVEYSQHILMVLKAIETKYYKDREEINRQVKELKTQIQVIKKGLPADYEGEVWEKLKVQDYYNKVSKAQETNRFIEQAKALKEGFETKLEAIKANAESDKLRVNAKYKEERQDIKDIVDLSKTKIEKANSIRNNVGIDFENSMTSLQNQMEKEIQEIRSKYEKLEAQKGKEINVRAAEQKDLINIQENKITQKTEELNGLDNLEKQELEAVDVKTESEIDKEKIRVGKAAEYLENNIPVNILPLQEEAEKVANMQSYLRQYGMMKDIRDNKLAEREREAADLTAKVEKARTLPSELLQTAKMPVEGISVDENGRIRIGGTLIGDLSDGEKLELSFTIAKAQCGELKVICVDKWESLDKISQDELMKEMENDSYQYFVTEVTSPEDGKIHTEVK